MFLCCLIFPNLLFLFHCRWQSLVFPNLEEVAFCRRRPMSPSSTLLFGHQCYVLWWAPLASYISKRLSKIITSTSEKKTEDGGSRWRSGRMVALTSHQTHQKYMYTWNRKLTERKSPIQPGLQEQFSHNQCHRNRSVSEGSAAAQTPARNTLQCPPSNRMDVPDHPLHTTALLWNDHSRGKDATLDFIWAELQTPTQVVSTSHLSLSTWASRTSTLFSFGAKAPVQGEGRTHT